MSEYNEKSKSYSIEYAKARLKRVPLDLPLAKYEELSVAAAAAGESINGYIKKAIDLRMGGDAT